MQYIEKTLDGAKLYRSVALKTKIYSDLERIAKRQDRSVTWLINHLLAEVVMKYNEGYTVDVSNGRKKSSRQ